MKKFLRGFSLVELIIVIAIIAILSVSAVMVLQKWIGESRDSRRLSDLEIIQKSLTINYADIDSNQIYPKPDDYQIVTGDNGENLWYQGYFGSNAVEKLDNLNKVPKDPRGIGYEYSVTADQKTWEVYAKLENEKKVSLVTDKAYAEDYRYIVKRGNYIGYIIGSTGDNYYLYNSPSLYITSGTQLTSGDVNNMYQEGESADSSVIVTGVDISNLKDDNPDNDETVYNKVKDKFGVSSTEAKKVVEKADGGSVNTSSTSDGDTTAPTITDVTTLELCGEIVRFSINGASDNVGLASEPYSFDGGDTWTGSKTKDYTTTGKTIPSGDIRVKDTSGNKYIHSSYVSGSASSGFCEFNLSDSSETSISKKLMTYQPSNVSLPSLSTNTTSDGIPTALEWGCYGDGIDGWLPESNIDGSGNTQTIVDDNCTDSNGNSGSDHIAADYCDQLSISVNGTTYSDWYLPAPYELDAMCERDSFSNNDCGEEGLNDMNIGGEFSSSSMWASKFVSVNYGSALSYFGTWPGYKKTREFAVQCVRSVN